MRVSSLQGLDRNPFMIAVQVDAGEKDEGVVHLAEPVGEDLLRQELGERIETLRRVEWDRQEGRIVAVLEERLGAVQISARQFAPAEEEVAPLLGAEIRSGSARIVFSGEARQFQGRVALMRKIFPSEGWPDLAAETLLSAPEDWINPFLKGIRTRAQLASLDLLPPLRAHLSWEKQRLLDERAPASLIVPSGHRVPLDYASGNAPILAVKLQEMFGLADTPAIAAGRVKVLLHLLSPGPPAGANYPGLAGVLERRLLGGEEGSKGPLPETPLARRPVERRPDEKDKTPSSLRKSDQDPSLLFPHPA